MTARFQPLEEWVYEALADVPNESMRETARRYLTYGDHPGDFMYYLLTNDFVGSYAHADSANRQCLDQWAHWLVNSIPARSWGSPEDVETFRTNRQNAYNNR